MNKANKPINPSYMNYASKPAPKVAKHRVSTGAMEQGITKITGIKSGLPTMPKIIFKPKAWAQMEYIVDNCQKEVGWFTLQTYDPNGNTFTVYDVILPEQEVTAVETAISGNDLGKAAYEVIQNGGDTTHIYGWFHSHVNMGVSPSGQDERQVEEFLEDLVDTPEIPAFIRGIMNKKGDIKLDVYYMHHGVAYTCVPYEVEQPEEWIAGLDALIKERVKEPVYTFTHKPYTSKPHTPAKAYTSQPRGNWWDGEEEAAGHTGFRGYTNDLTEEEEVRELAIYNGDYDDIPDDMEMFGYDWDIEDPIEARPQDWAFDPDYQREGLHLDTPANRKAAEAIYRTKSLQ